MSKLALRPPRGPAPISQASCEVLVGRGDDVAVQVAEASLPEAAVSIRGCARRRGCKVDSACFCLPSSTAVKGTVYLQEQGVHCYF